uniref:F-box domain-containing protein n=1 Tax=Chromera velia CCMP2878 TaxID=1169474 RepID=A0A0G4I3M3_9ALVE|eukprot:Cvel_10665.t1-p1 / transcript=Cvel_10665.t1 / gene=Cvel_10665 / organism=Chromera_velia_CCMP2878 / gene_product=hypothetical protein / transcript_product=hypothetical protein / location=Cvel_scaffold648:44752-46236(-) / protein_length=495 / sequence_SO=supercontig / SO=protein_coding / is_pseudo=false
MAVGRHESGWMKYLYLGQRMRGGHASILKSLDLTGCGLSEEQACALFPYLPSSLESLKLTGNDEFGREGQEELRKRLSGETGTEGGLSALKVLHVSFLCLSASESGSGGRSESSLPDGSVDSEEKSGGSKESSASGSESESGTSSEESESDSESSESESRGSSASSESSEPVSSDSDASTDSASEVCDPALISFVESLPQSLKVLDMALKGPGRDDLKFLPLEFVEQLSKRFSSGTLSLTELTLRHPFSRSSTPSLSEEGVVSLFPSLPPSLESLLAEFSVMGVESWGRIRASLAETGLGGSLKTLHLRGLEREGALVLFPLLPSSLETLSLINEAIFFFDTWTVDSSGWRALGERFDRGDMGSLSELELEITNLDEETSETFFSSLPPSLEKLLIYIENSLDVRSWSGFAHRLQSKPFDCFRELKLKGLSRCFHNDGMEGVMQGLPSSLESLPFWDTSTRNEAWTALAENMEGGGLGRLRAGFGLSLLGVRPIE